MGKEVKTNAMRILDRHKVAYEILNYECDEFIDGLHTAELTGAPVEQDTGHAGKKQGILCLCGTDCRRGGSKGGSKGGR